MARILVKNLVVISILVFSITILTENYSQAFAYLSPLSNSTNQTGTMPPSDQQFPPCPPNYTPANFPCTVTIGNSTKVIGAPEGSNIQSPGPTPVVPEFGPLAGVIIAISIIGMVVISRNFRVHL